MRGSQGQRSRGKARNPRQHWRFGKKIPTDKGWISNIGGADEDRTHDLCIANAALSQLSYRPTSF